ncbi:MAG: ABC transporter ATP-binding protein, partial [Desulfobulbus sp.]
MSISEKSATSRQALALLVPVFKQFRLRLFLGFSALLGVDFLQLIVPKILKKGIDSLADQSANLHSLLLLAALVLGIAACVALLRFVWRILIIGFSRILEKRLRVQLFTHLVRMDRSFYHRWSAGSLMAHAGNDLAAVQMACGMGMVAAADALVMSTASIGFMLAIDTRLTALALLPMPLLALSTWILSKKMHLHFSRVQEQFGRLTEFARNALVSITLVKGYCLERAQEKKFAELGKTYVRNNLRVAILQGLLHPMATLAGNTGMLLVLYFGGMMVIKTEISLGSFVAFITYLAMLIWPMMAVGWVANLAQRGLTSLRRIATLLEKQPSLEDGVKAQILRNPREPWIRCNDLSFTYPGSKRPALQHINVAWSTGIYGIAGRSGSGKSTLCRLILRLYPIDNGMLYLGGEDINQYLVATVRKQFAYVGEQTALFSDTIYNNISFGLEGASRQQVEAAAKAAAIHEYIINLDKGYDARVGEQGVKLSGGQRQRIALARALVSNRPILIIDNGLSALDVSTEQEVFTNIGRQYGNRLVLLVSHRVNLLSRTREIILLDQGKIVAVGD